MLEAGIKLRYVFNSRKSEEFTKSETNEQNREYQTRELKVDLEMGMQRLGIRSSRQPSPTPNRQKDFCCNNLFSDQIFACE